MTAREAAANFVSISEDCDRHEQLVEHIENLWGSTFAQLMECEDCGFGFSNPFVSGDPEFYRLAYVRSAYPTARWEFDHTLDCLGGRLSSVRSVLEIGAGDGVFLDLLRPQLGSDVEIHATEFYQGGLCKLREKGYFAHSGDFRCLPEVAERTFDLIFMFQVLEHLNDVTQVFEQLRKMLRPGGEVFVAVPNKRRTTFNEENHSLIDMPPNHVGRWEPRTFDRLAERTGFDLVSHRFQDCSVRQFVKTDIYYSHCRRAQEPGSLAGWLRSIERGGLRKAAIISEMLLFAPTRLAVWRRAANRNDLGGALWAQMRRAG
ncbi:MAG: class I SAM-dependent methyltransferase [Planctomycetaceae bacterium]